MARSRSSSSLHRTQVALARRFLREHLADELTLPRVARAAAAAPSHFVRLYRAFTGETPFRTLRRFRLEAAARALRSDPTRAVSTIALETGWATPSSFDKAFREAFGQSPGAYRRTPALLRPRLTAPPRPVRSKDFQLARSPRFETGAAFEVAFVREQGEYSEVSAPLAWRRLDQCLQTAPERYGPPVGASYDDPRVNAPERLRYDAGVLLGPRQAPPPGTARARWGGGRYAVFDFHGPYRFIAAGFDSLFRWWPRRPWPDLRDAAFLEVYRSDPRVVPDAQLHTELWIPVES